MDFCFLCGTYMGAEMWESLDPAYEHRKNVFF